MKEICIRKFQFIQVLRVAKEVYGLNTIDELIADLNKKVLNDTDIVIRFKEDAEEMKELEAIE